MRHALRLARLEAVVDVSNADLSKLTDDELSIGILDLSRRIAADPEAPADIRELSQRNVVEVEAAVRWQAALGNHPTYAAFLQHLAEVIEGFTPAITGFLAPAESPCRGASANGSRETADLEKPHAMARRAALRARPDIAALIAAGAAEAVTLEHSGSFVAGPMPDAAVKQLRDRYPTITKPIEVRAVEAGVGGHA